MTFIKAFYNGEIRRIGLENVNTFRDLEHELQDLFHVEGTPLKIQYKDEDGDDVVMSSDKELQAAIALSDGLLRLHLSPAPKSLRSQSVAEASTEWNGLSDKQRSASVVDKPSMNPEPPRPAQQKMLFGRGKAAPKAQPQNYDTFARHNKQSGPGVTPLKLNTAALSGDSGPTTPQPTSAKGKSPGLGLKLDLKAVKGDYEATPVPNINNVDAGSDSDTEDLTDDNTEETEGSDEEGGEGEGEENKDRTKKPPPGRSFSAFLGFRKTNAKGLKQRDPGTIRIINHAPAPQVSSSDNTKQNKKLSFLIPIH
eukprot:TRINITY_DN4858_c0_g1_i1.p1 TRINITY_DN4858_c0_g1~~TRINITY_DN4858_c0_g1_i1.p1  ORF type:complete len:310 (-),score=60.12 TRINITY_DN4858_c0_g1_i1:677-1606(-)